MVSTSVWNARRMPFAMGWASCRASVREGMVPMLPIPPNITLGRLSQASPALG